MPYGIAGVGGAELYILGKLRWLKEHDWDVYVLSGGGYTDKAYKIKELDAYRNQSILVLNRMPYECTKHIIKKVIQQMLENVNSNKHYEETIIESHTASTALWGELLAKRLEAKHIVHLINESFNDVGYMDKFDFFQFKRDRKEVFGGLHAFQSLFGKKYKITQHDVISFGGLQENPVQDIEDSRLDLIQESDYTICYIGRVLKPYVPNVIKGVAEFAKSHTEFKIQFVIVGDPTQRINLIRSELLSIPNLQVILMGDMFPLPRKLFTTLDVVIAGSGSAKCAAYENVPAIVADPDSCLSNGVLGYDIIKSVGTDSDTKQTTFDEALESVLIREDYKKLPNRLPPQKTVEECCENNFIAINQSSQTYEYYDSEIICKGDATLKGRVKALLSFYFPKMTIIIKNYKK